MPLMDKKDVILLQGRLQQLTNRHIAKAMEQLEINNAPHIKRAIKSEFWRLNDDIIESFNQYVKGEGIDTWRASIG